MLSPFVHNFVLITLEGNSDVLERLLEGVADADPIWDLRPDPARFTLREIVGHLADWNGVFMQRITQIRDEDSPDSVARKVEDIARESGSFVAAPADSLARFRTTRLAMIPTLRALEPNQWERTGNIVGHPIASGAVSIESWFVQIAGHDGYHLQQIAQWLKPTFEKE